MWRNYVKKFAIELYDNFFNIILLHDQNFFFSKKLFFLLIAEKTVVIMIRKRDQFFPSSTQRQPSVHNRPWASLLKCMVCLNDRTIPYVYYFFNQRDVVIFWT